jgi:Trypsin
MHRKILVFAIFVVLLAITVMPAAAITGKFVKDFKHPFVGLAVFYDETGAFSHRCSGSLLSPTVFLTAGHCFVGVASARVYFQQDAGAHFDPLTQIDPYSGYPDVCAEGTEAVCTASHRLENFATPGTSRTPTTPGW